MRPGRSPAPGYLIGIAAAMAVTVIRYSLAGFLGDTATYTPYVIPVMLAGWYGGLRPAMAAMAASVLLGAYFVVPPSFSFNITWARDAVAMAIYVICASVIGALSESMHQAQRAVQRHQRDLQQEEAAHGESRARLSLAVEAAHLTAFEWDVASNRVTRLGEVHADAPLGASYPFAAMVETIHPDDRASMLGRLEATLRGDTDIFISEHRSNNNPEREWCWARVRGRLLRDAAGGPMKMYGVSMDITEHKRLEDALRESDRRKDEFLATLAHELRNPLAPIQNALYLLKLRGAAEQDVVNTRQVIERQVTQMARLLDDLMDVSRISRGVLELRPEATDLRTVLQRALETSRPLLSDRGHDVQLDLPEGDGLAISADLARLTQVMANLLNNAARYTDQGGTITVSARREGDAAIVSVRDTGIGIEQEQLESVFGMFARADSARARSSDGLGIGLSLARSIVTLHGGTLTASSEGPGHGSEFVVRLPLSAPAPAVTEGVAAGAMEPIAPAPAPWRLVIADDMRDATDSLAELLRLRGHEVATAYDGVEAVAVTTAFRPDAVLLDLAMPKMDGHAACRAIRRLPAGRDLIIVALTGWGQPMDRELTRVAGFTAHLIKPVDHEAVLETLNALRSAGLKDTN